MAFSIDEKQEGSYEAKLKPGSSTLLLRVVIEMLMLLDEVLMRCCFLFVIISLRRYCFGKVLPCWPWYYVLIAIYVFFKINQITDTV